MNPNRHLDTHSIDFRVKHGKPREAKVVRCLQSNGYPDLRAATDEEDMHGKIDGLFVSSGKTIQNKTRDGNSGDDLLLDLFEPFHGMESDDTEPGRDNKKKCDYYGHLSNNQKEVRLLSGERVWQIIDGVLAEWEKEGFPLPFSSERFRRVELIETRDKANHRPKLLIFIPPKLPWLFNATQVKVFKVTE